MRGYEAIHEERDEGRETIRFLVLFVHRRSDYEQYRNMLQLGSIARLLIMEIFDYLHGFIS